jgi:pimeloyl-ACP methyl ester carboxylesterase
MSGTKAEAIAAHAAATGRPCFRFDYSGHGESGGDLAGGTISGWLAEAAQAFSTRAGGPRILVGSSMGGWLALLLLRRLRSADPAAAARIRGLVLIAPAADMTTLVWDRLSDAARRQITAEGCCFEPSRYGPEPYLYTLALIEDGRRHLLLQQGLDLPCPLRILQGDQDPDVSYDHALRTFHALRGDDIRLTLIKGGDHRLSTPRDIALLLATIDELAQASDEERQ